MEKLQENANMQSPKEKPSESTLHDSQNQSQTDDRPDDGIKEEDAELPNHDVEASDHDHTAMDRRPSNAGSVWVYETLSLPREALLVAIVCMCQFCTQAAFFSTLVLLRTIGQSFHVTNPPRLAWLVAGYSLTVGTFILFSGRLGDVFGYKRMLVLGLSWFSLWSMVAGLSVYSNYTLAVFARVLQGIGPAICLPNALAIFGIAYPPGHRKAMVFAFFGAVAPIGAIFGGTFASLLNLVWWPWALWVLTLWLAFLAVIGQIAIPELPQKVDPPRGWKNWIEVLDVPGAIVGVVSMILFNFAWTQAPVSGWKSPTVLVPLVLGFVMFGLFGYIEFKVSKMPLLPFDAVNADVAFVLAAIVCGWANFGIWTLYVVQMLQEIRHLSPLLTTAWFAPVVVAGGGAAVVTGKLLGPWGVRPPIVMTFALASFTIGGALAAFWPVNQIYWGQLFVSMLIMPFGMDMSFPAATLTLSNAVSKEHQGIGASLVNTVVNYGIALGVGFAGTVELHVNGDGATSEERLRGFKGALYLGVGLAGLGLLICLVFLTRELFIRKK